MNEKVNIGALQAIMGVGGKTLTNSAQSTESSMQSFGNVFAGITMKSVTVEQAGNEETMQIPFEMIQQLFDAKSPEELELVLQAIPGYENIEFSKEMGSIGSIANVEDLAKILSIGPGKLIETLKEAIGQAVQSVDQMEALKKVFNISSGIEEVTVLNETADKAIKELKKTVEQILDELTITTDIWAILNAIDEVGQRFFNNLNDAVSNVLTKEDAVDVLLFLKAIELAAPKTDMTLPIEQKMFSFQSMIQSASEQFQQLTQSLNVSKPEVMQFIQQPNFIVVVQSDASSSTSDENATQKQAEMTNHNTNSGNTVVTQTRTEFSIPQTDSAGSSRSEALMREMQMLFKRSNFGQVGGSTRMLIKLYPEHLGQIRIELHETNGVLTARILASTALAKGMLDSQMHQLRNALAQQNLQVERIDVTQSIQESSKNEREQAFNEQFNREQKEESKQNNSSSGDDEMSFEEFMIELEV